MATTETVSFELGLFKADVLVTLFTEGELAQQELEKNRALHQAAHDAERAKIKTEKEKTVGIVLEEHVFRTPISIDKIKSIIAHGITAFYYDKTGKGDWEKFDVDEDIALLMKERDHLESECNRLQQQVGHLQTSLDAYRESVKNPNPTVPRATESASLQEPPVVQAALPDTASPDEPTVVHSEAERRIKEQMEGGR